MCISSYFNAGSTLRRYGDKMEQWLSDKLNDLKLRQTKAEVRRSDALKIAKESLLELEDIKDKIDGCWATNNIKRKQL